MIEDVDILRLLKTLKEYGKMSITKLHLRTAPISFYKVKLEFVPELERRGIVKVTKNGNHTYVELTEKGKRKSYGSK